MDTFIHAINTIPVQAVIITSALIAVLTAFAVQRRTRRSAFIDNFASVLSADISALSDPGNIAMDAFSVLENRFSAQHDSFIRCNDVGVICKYRLKRAWQNYYGEEGEQEWWLPNEYSSSHSNQLKNTCENTKKLAIHRLTKLIKLCK